MIEFKIDGNILTATVNGVEINHTCQDEMDAEELKHFIEDIATVFGDDLNAVEINIGKYLFGDYAEMDMYFLYVKTGGEPLIYDGGKYEYAEKTLAFVSKVIGYENQIS